MKRLVIAAALAATIATPAAASQWWLIQKGPPLNCLASNMPPSLIARQLDGYVTPVTQDAVTVTVVIDGRTKDIAMFRSLATCEAVVTQMKKDDAQYE